MGAVLPEHSQMCNLSKKYRFYNYSLPALTIAMMGNVFLTGSEMFMTSSLLLMDLEVSYGQIWNNPDNNQPRPAESISVEENHHGVDI